MLQGFATINHSSDDLDAARRSDAELLGVEPHFERRGPDGWLAYAEFRIGDYRAELGLGDRGWGGRGDHLLARRHIEAAFEKLPSMGATQYQPITPRGDEGFVTAAVVDPSGNVLGIMVAEQTGKPRADDLVPTEAGSAFGSTVTRT